LAVASALRLMICVLHLM